MFDATAASKQFASEEVLTVVVEVGPAGVDDGKAEQKPHPHPQHVLVVCVAVQQVRGLSSRQGQVHVGGSEAH